RQLFGRIRLVLRLLRRLELRRLGHRDRDLVLAGSFGRTWWRLHPIPATAATATGARLTEPHDLTAWLKRQERLSDRGMRRVPNHEQREQSNAGVRSERCHDGAAHPLMRLFKHKRNV